MSDPDAELGDAEAQGERTNPEMTFQWIDPSPVEEGEFIVPAKLSSTLAREFAAFHLIMDDLGFASDCFLEADRIGVPDGTNVVSTALINAGVVAYSRPFVEGVRAVRLKPDELASASSAFRSHVHNYLLNLRNKHVAHSVNGFEDCQAIAVIVGRPETAWRDGSGIGVIVNTNVGISREILREAIEHIVALRNHLKGVVERLRGALYAEFKVAFDADGKWEVAPMVRFPERGKIAKRRPEGGSA